MKICVVDAKQKYPSDHWMVPSIPKTEDRKSAGVMTNCGSGNLTCDNERARLRADPTSTTNGDQDSN